MKSVRFLSVTLTVAFISLFAVSAFAGDDCSTCISKSACASKSNAYGAKFEKANFVKLANLKESSEVVTTEGTIEQVCQAAGCWLMITDGNKKLFVKAKGEEYKMPKNSAGAKAKAQGIVKEQEFSEAMIKHFAEDGMKFDGEIKGPRKMFMMVANGVEITPKEGMKLESVDAYKCADDGHDKDDHKKGEGKKDAHQGHGK
ncbi:MAG: DUF4920 domain-containing protein [bacterium]|nr:DUF4920 domain-containing protein [bacterium]